jgi:hypothetical protein
MEAKGIFEIRNLRFGIRGDDYVNAWGGDLATQEGGASFVFHPELGKLPIIFAMCNTNNLDDRCVLRDRIDDSIRALPKSIGVF